MKAEGECFAPFNSIKLNFKFSLSRFIRGHLGTTIDPAPALLSGRWCFASHLVTFSVQTCGTQLSKAKAEVGCEALSSSLDAWFGNSMLQEDTSSALRAEASPCKKKSCDSIARGVQQTRFRTLSATKHRLYSLHAAQQAKT